jgi:hypothetical protein
LLCRSDRCRIDGDEDIDFALHKLSDEIRISFEVALWVAILNQDVLAFNVTEVS